MRATTRGVARMRHESRRRKQAGAAPVAWYIQAAMRTAVATRRIVLLGLLVSCCTCSLAPASTRADEACGGVRVADKAEALGSALVLNGVGIRRATFLNVHVYVAGLYLEQRTRKVALALQPAASKLIELHFVRDVSRKEMIDAMRGGLEKNAGPQLAAAREHMESFERYLPELHKGMRLSLAFHAGQGLEVRADGKLLGVEHDDRFANLVFQIWLGDHPPDSALKAGLLGAPCH
jgi:Chalcone isomerase-like